MSLRTAYSFPKFFVDLKYQDRLPPEGLAFSSPRAAYGNNWYRNYKMALGAHPTWKADCRPTAGDHCELSLSEVTEAKNIIPKTTGMLSLVEHGYGPEHIQNLAKYSVVAAEFPNCCGAVQLYGFGIGQEPVFGSVFFQSICDWFRLNKYGLVFFILTRSQSAGIDYLLKDSQIAKKLTVTSQVNPNSGHTLDSYILKL